METRTTQASGGWVAIHSTRAERMLHVTRVVICSRRGQPTPWGASTPFTRRSRPRTPHLVQRLERIFLVTLVITSPAAGSAAAATGSAAASLAPLTAVTPASHRLARRPRRVLPLPCRASTPPRSEPRSATTSAISERTSPPGSDADARSIGVGPRPRDQPGSIAAHGTRRADHRPQMVGGDGLRGPRDGVAMGRGDDGRFERERRGGRPIEAVTAAAFFQTGGGRSNRVEAGDDRAVSEGCGHDGRAACARGSVPEEWSGEHTIVRTGPKNDTGTADGSG